MNYLAEEEEIEKLLFIGLSQSGKTSIIQVFFEGLMPELTLTNQATIKVNRKKIDISGKLISLFEVGGQIAYLEEMLNKFKENVFSHIKTMFFIIDASKVNELEKAKFYFEQSYNHVLEYNKNFQIIALLHKVDLISKEEKSSLINKIQDDFGLQKKVNCFITTSSIYDEKTHENIKKFIK